MDVPSGLPIDDDDMLGEGISGISLAENPILESFHFAEISSHESDVTDTTEETQLQLFRLACDEDIKFQESRSMEDLNRAMTLYCYATSIIPVDSHLYCKVLFNLSCTLENRFRAGGQQRDLDQAILLNQGALHIPNDDTQLLFLDFLAEKFQTRFKHTELLGDLDEAIALRREVLDLDILPPTSRHIFLRKLARALKARFKKYREQKDLEQAVSLHRECIELISSEPHPDRPQFLRGLADLLGDLYVETGQGSNLDEAILLYREALDLHDPSAEERSTTLNNLANTLKWRFDQASQPQDIQESIMLHKQTLELFTPTHPDRSTYIINLANAVIAQFEQTGQECDLDEAILLYREAQTLDLEDSGPPRESQYMAVNNLATALQHRFTLTGQREDLEESIQLHRGNLKLVPLRHSRRAEYLTNLANSLFAVHSQTGHRDTIDEAIVIYREALELFSPLHPDRFRLLNSLAQIVNDHEEAVSLYKEALELQSVSNPHRVYVLTNLARRLNATTRLEDIDEAVRLCREAHALHDTAHPSQSSVLESLAGALVSRFKRTGHQDNIDEAIVRYKQALKLLPSSSPSLQSHLSDLGHAFHTRYKHTRALEDLSESLASHRKALDLYPSSHPRRYFSLTDLGNILVLAHLRMGDPDYMEQAMSFYRVALQSSPHSASIIHGIAYNWSYHADRLEHSSALEAYDAALSSLSQMASLSLDIYSRRQRIIPTIKGGLVTRAARYALRRGHLGKAIEFLEGGRAIFWSQALHLRTSFDRLRESAPELAHRLQSIATELEHASYRNTLRIDSSMDNTLRMSLEMQESQFRRLGEEWSKGLNEARSIPGFEDILQARRLVLLQAAATKYPIVILVPGKDTSDCIVMTSTEIHHIPLTGLSEQTLCHLVNMTKSSHSQKAVSCSEVSNAAAASSGPEEQERSKGTLGGRRSKFSSSTLFEYVLKTLWLEVVKPVVEILSLQKSETPPTLKWCPTGIFSFLPIHAAGCYNPSHGALECASDYMVSSYTPTISGLLPPKEANISQSQRPFEMVVVVSAELPSASVELEKIRARVPNNCLVELGSDDAPSHVNTVYSRLQNASIIHFACHGVQDQLNPLDSALLVDNGKLSISKIMQQSLPTGSLAFLCACETAMGDENTPDEAMSIGACLLFSGYRSVIATMWKIMDEDGPTIADAFYEELLEGFDGKATSQPDISRSALALHVAIRKLRLSGVGYNRWVPFIHMGQ